MNAPVWLSLCLASIALTVPVYGAQDSQNTAAAPETAPARMPDTLMFSIDELNDVQGRISTADEDDDESDAAAIEDATLFVSTIIYAGPNDWTVWINGKPITAGQELKAFEITAIDPSSVELLVPLSAQGMRPVRLSPNQTFIAKSGAVVEGAWTP